MNSSVIAEFYCSPVKMRRVVCAVFIGILWVMADASSGCGDQGDIVGRGNAQCNARAM